MSHATHLGEPLAVLERAVDPDVLVRRERDLLRDLLHKAGLAVAVRAFTGGAGEGVAAEGRALVSTRRARAPTHAPKHGWVIRHGVW